jgi:hypothetical protein
MEDNAGNRGGLFALNQCELPTTRSKNYMCRLFEGAVMQKTVIVATLAAVVVGAILAYIVVSSTGITNISESARTKAIQSSE